MRFIYFSFIFCIVFSLRGWAQPDLTLTPVITGLTAPMQLVHAGDGSHRIFLIEKEGVILVYDSSYTFRDTFLVVSGLATDGERGLLSLVFHPAYKTIGLFYVYYTNTNGDLELARYTVSSANPDSAAESSKKIVMTIPHPTNANHNGGELHFGNDGYLYLSTGDGGGAGDPSNNAQNTSVLLGKILRFAVNASETPPFYSIPASNPFGNGVFAYGLRNPFRWSFDRLTYDMWIGDVGQNDFEEFNYRPSDSTKGVNYGWRCFEGAMPYDMTVGCTGPASDYNFPVSSYPTPSPGAVTGGTVYRGNTYIALRGYYVGTDFFTGILYRIKYDTLTHTAATYPQTNPPLVTNISDFGETEDGELYAVSLSQGTVYRVSATGPIGYTFTGNGNWDLSTNWSNNKIPPSNLPAGEEIIINPVTSGEAILNVPQVILTGAKITVQNGKKFRINGNLTIQ